MTPFEVLTEDEIIALIRAYPEWEDDLDETCCPTGVVYCPVCEGGGSTDRRRRRPPEHHPGCLREKFEDAMR